MNFEESTALQTVQGSEIETSALAAGAISEVQAMMLWAARSPRNEDKALNAMLKRAESEKFADLAVYEIERKNWKTGEIKIIQGLTVECTRDLLIQWGNARIGDAIIADTERYLIGRVTSYDVEKNVQIPEVFIVSKVWERSKTREGDEVIGERIKENGQKLYLIKVPDLELNNAFKAQRARSLRNVILSIVPSHHKEAILEKCLATKHKTSEEAVKSGEAAKAIVSAFSEFEVTEAQIVQYLGHALSKMTTKEHVHLRGVYRSMKNEGNSWDHIMEMAGKAKEEPEKGKLNLDNMQPGTPEQQEERPPRKKPGPKPGSKNKTKETSTPPSQEAPPEEPKTIPESPPVDQEQAPAPPAESNLFPKKEQSTSPGKMGADEITEAKLAELTDMLKDILKFKFNISDEGRIKAACNLVTRRVMATSYEEMTMDDIEEAVLYVTTGTQFEDDLRQENILPIKR